MAEECVLTEEQAHWLRQIVEAPAPPYRASVPDEIAAHLERRELIRAVGDMVVVTYSGVSALAAHRGQAA